VHSHPASNERRAMNVGESKNLKKGSPVCWQNNRNEVGCVQDRLRQQSSCHCAPWRHAGNAQSA